MKGWLPWYNHLKKPLWTPEGKTISVIWTLLYPFIFLSYLYVFYLGLRGNIPAIVALPFILNLIFNFAFTPIQFLKRSLLLASLDIILVWLTVVWSIYTIFPYSPWVAYIQLPYLLWVTVASILQFSITAMNRR